MLLWSAPVVLLVIAGIVALCGVTWQERRAADAVQAGTAAVADGDLDAAERQFARALDLARSCPAAVDLALVGETRGDQSVAAGDGPGALRRYRAALATVTAAPDACFAGNADPDPQRRDVLATSADRLQTKIATLERPLPPPPVPPPPPPAGPPPPAAAAGAAPEPGDTPRVLAPGAPLDQLGQLLGDAAGVRGAP